MLLSWSSARFDYENALSAKSTCIMTECKETSLRVAQYARLSKKSTQY